MEEPGRFWVVTFDIAADANRNAAHRLLGQHGVRSLYSVYELHAGTTTVDTLVERLHLHIRDHDHLLALPGCPRCRTAAFGSTIEQLPPHAWVTA